MPRNTINRSPVDSLQNYHSTYKIPNRKKKQFVGVNLDGYRLAMPLVKGVEDFTKLTTFLLECGNLEYFDKDRKQILIPRLYDFNYSAQSEDEKINIKLTEGAENFLDNLETINPEYRSQKSGFQAINYLLLDLALNEELESVIRELIVINWFDTTLSILTPDQLNPKFLRL